MDDMMKAMLDSTQQREQENARQQQEQQTKEEERQRFQQMITERRDQLVSTFGTLVDEFNQRSSSGQISVSKNGNHIRYSLPHQQEDVILEFFTVDPPLNLSKKNLGIVSLAAYLEGHQGAGRNFLWCRENADDMQGRWVTCRVNTSAMVRPKPGRKPYGIIYGFDNPDELREIEASISMMHVYEVSFEDDVQKGFMQVLLEAIKSA